MEGDVGIYRGDTGYGGYVWGLGRYGEMTHLTDPHDEREGAVDGTEELRRGVPATWHHQGMVRREGCHGSSTGW